MITFVLSLALLIVGYFTYGYFVEKVFGVDSSRPTPAYTKQDGVDYIPLKGWRIFLIQFLNIAGLGPIFGAIMGAKFGTASFLWIVFGSIFAGAVHDFFSGMISLRYDGDSLPEIHGRYLGNGVKQFMRGFMVLLMVLVGVVFVVGPADILADLTPSYLNSVFWVAVILVYYILATLLPIDKIIGKIYPIFGVCLLFMALGILGYILIAQPILPEVWHGLHNKQADPSANPIFPMMFVSIACGAISGFHATQSPLMARCMTNERQGRKIFYGSMITEGIVALIWAAAATVFFYSGDYADEVSALGSNAPKIVKFITENWLGTIGAVLALLGVVFAPITSGDTALRSARLIVADFLNYDQKPIVKRLIIALPIFAVTFIILLWDLKNPDGFNIIWNYFAWANQVLSAFTLWAISVYLLDKGPKNAYWITMVPALFMTFICSSFLGFAKIGFNMPLTWSYVLGAVVSVASLVLFYRWKVRRPTSL